MFAAVSQTRPRRSLQPSAAVQQPIKSSSSSGSGGRSSRSSNVDSMDVEAKIGCSLDELIKMQRRGPRGPSHNSTQNGAAPQRINRRGGPFRKPLRQLQKPQRLLPQRQQQQVRFTPRPMQQQQQQQNRYEPRAQQPKQQQKSRTLSVEDKINLPLDALIASQRQPQQQPRQQQQQPRQQQQQPHEQQARRQPQLQQKVRPAAFRTAVSGRRGAFLVPRVGPRRGRLNAAAAAAAAARPPLRSAASKALAVAAGGRGGRIRTLHQQTVKTLKPTGAFKAAARGLSRSSIVYPRAAAAPAPVGARRLASGRLQLRQPAAAAPYVGARINTSLARRRQFGAAAAAATAATAAAAAAASAARSTAGSSSYTSYRTSPPTVKSLPVDRRRPSSTLKEAAAVTQDPPSPPSFAAAADPEMLPIIKIQASLDTVPAPLPQQRGAHVAIPAAMQREQQQQQQTPSRSVGATGDFGTLSSRFGY